MLDSTMSNQMAVRREFARQPCSPVAPQPRTIALQPCSPVALQLCCLGSAKSSRLPWPPSPPSPPWPPLSSLRSEDDHHADLLCGINLELLSTRDVADECLVRMDLEENRNNNRPRMTRKRETIDGSCTYCGCGCQRTAETLLHALSFWPTSVPIVVLGLVVRSERREGGSRARFVITLTDRDRPYRVLPGHNWAESIM